MPEVNKIYGSKYSNKALMRFMVSCLFAFGGFGSVMAHAQTDAHADEKAPIPTSRHFHDSANTAEPATSIKPEELKKPRMRIINPNDIRLKPNRSNRWDLSYNRPAKLGSASYVRPVKKSSSPKPAELATQASAAEELLAPTSSNIDAYGLKLAKAPGSDAIASLSDTLRGALFELPSFGASDTVFKLDLAGQLCLGTEADCQSRPFADMALDFATNINAGKRGGINLQLTPRGSVHFGDGGKSALVGALVRIGDNLRQGADMKPNTWYLFAGADAEALTYTPGSIRRLTSGVFHLQDRIIIGDAQAGLGYKIGDADLSLTYFHRQARAENYSYNEDAAALSITWRR